MGIADTRLASDLVFFIPNACTGVADTRLASDLVFFKARDWVGVRGVRVSKLTLLGIAAAKGREVDGVEECTAIKVSIAFMLQR